MADGPRAEHCVDATLSTLVTPYCFGEASEQERRAFELHLLECDACWNVCARVLPAIQVLRADAALAHTVTIQEAAGLMGLSSRVGERFAGHTRHAVVTSVTFGALFAVPMLVELAYRWDTYGTVAGLLAGVALAWMTSTTFVSLWLVARSRRSGGTRATSVLALGTILLCVLAVVALPSARTVEASFSTYPAHLGYLKSVFYAWLVGPIFVIWPYAFIVALQRELAEGRHRGVLALLGGDAMGVPPTGHRFPRVWALCAYWAGLFAFHWTGVSHLFDNLLPGPYSSAFMALVMLRVGITIALPAWCIWWYAGMLTELKREAAAVTRLLDGQP